jgi:hypothetical protein
MKKFQLLIVVYVAFFSACKKEEPEKGNTPVFYHYIAEPYNSDFFYKQEMWPMALHVVGNSLSYYHCRITPIDDTYYNSEVDYRVDFDVSSNTYSKTLVPHSLEFLEIYAIGDNKFLGIRPDDSGVGSNLYLADRKLQTDGKYTSISGGISVSHFFELDYVKGLPNGNFIIVAGDGSSAQKVHIYCFDPQLKLVWSEVLSTAENANYQFISNVVVSENGIHILINTSVNSTGQKFQYYRHYDFGGTMLHYVREPSTLVSWQSLIVNNEGVYVIGNEFIPSKNGSDLFISRFDESGVFKHISSLNIDANIPPSYKRKLGNLSRTPVQYKGKYLFCFSVIGNDRKYWDVVVSLNGDFSLNKVNIIRASEQADSDLILIEVGGQLIATGYSRIDGNQSRYYCKLDENGSITTK